MPLLLYRALFIIIIIVLPATAGGTILDSLLHLLPPPYQSVLSQPDRYNLQILYTQINRDVQNRPHFTHFSFHVDPKQYFYPASLVKLPVAVLALEKINRLGIRGFNRRSRMKIDCDIGCNTIYDSDDNLPSDSISIESSIKRMLLVSDNGGYNRLWEFLTRDYANRRLAECGYGGIRLLHRFSGCAGLQNRENNPIRFFGKQGKVLFTQPQTVSQLPDVNPLAPVFMGSFSYRNGLLIPHPFRADFLNYIPLEEEHRLLIAVMFPATVERKKSFLLTASDYYLLRTWMCLLPHESGIPRYAPDSGYPDNFKKYLLFGDSTHPCVPHLREFNVVGRAYGFMSDVAYFADFDARVEFFLSAVIFANEDDIINDDQYEYNSLALPFFSALGAAVCEYEKKRHRRHRPDLREFLTMLPVSK